MSNSEILASIEAGEKLPSFEEEIHKELEKVPRTIVILDDDPTGTQTVYNVPVITEWEEATIEKEILYSSIFFILTNSRSLAPDKAQELGTLIGERLLKIALKNGKRLVVISRSDSTLRGHYPNEVNALVSGLELKNTKHILAPAFFEGGRYTFKDVHYVREGEQFIPAAKTPFAKDNTFGYQASNLKDWVEEKTCGQIKSSEVSSVGVNDLRNWSTAQLSTYLEKEKSEHVVLNATCYSDLQVFALACLRAKGNFIYRTGASFVNAISGIPLRDCLTKTEILGKVNNRGALVVIGSYVPKTTQQLDYVKKSADAYFLELDTTHVLKKGLFENQLFDLSQQIDTLITSGKKVILYTSRQVVKGATKMESLEIVNTVSRGVIDIIRKLNNRPKYILAKGGITSSDVATKGLEVRRALVLGQVIKGVPVWRLGSEAKFPDLPYIVFPGNVGGESALLEVINLLE